MLQLFIGNTNIPFASWVALREFMLMLKPNTLCKITTHNSSNTGELSKLLRNVVTLNANDDREEMLEQIKKVAGFWAFEPVVDVEYPMWSIHGSTFYTAWPVGVEPHDIRNEKKKWWYKIDGQEGKCNKWIVYQSIPY
jgi:hypothetical protein